MPVHVIVDAGGARNDALRACIRTLLSSGARLTIANTEAGIGPRLKAEFGERISIGVPATGSEDVLVTSGEVVFATGSLGRLRARTAAPGRIVTRVYVPGIAGEQTTALWSGEWLASQGIAGADVLGLDLGFDRTRLPLDSPTARIWVAAGEVGIAAWAGLGTDVGRWSRATGRRLSADALVTALRAPVGVMKRRTRLWQQRRKMAGSHSSR